MNATTATDTTSPRTVELAPGTWTIDPGHAEVGFVGRHFGLTKVRGRFTGVEGIVVVARDITESTIDVTIDMSTVSSGDSSRDDHLRSGDFFDVVDHPTGHFRSSGISLDGGRGTIDGELTLKGVTRSVSLNAEFLGTVLDPWGGERAIFSANTTIDREDWGLTWNMVLDAGGLLVSKKIQLEIEVELIRQAG
ncbi:MAG: polyisoprenoid-binding protein [Acidimicrobiales bacterium]|jgi:polyisoprenoid-binding protein YceI|nr:polyisoprenoid-binding protein [Acidimicrobiales bacterium]